MLKVLVVVCLLIEAGFLYPFVKNTWPHETTTSLICKMVCSTMFLGVGILSKIISGNDSKFAMIVIIGLIFAWVGDLLLQLPGKAIFVIGGAMFLITHICYIYAYTTQIKVFEPDRKFFNVWEILIAVAIVVLFDLYNRHLKVNLGKMRIPVWIYAFMLSTMVIKACSLGINLFKIGNITGALLIIIGAFCFFYSDVSLTYTMLEERRKGSFWYKFFNSLTYFTGQALIALSVMFVL